MSRVTGLFFTFDAARPATLPRSQAALNRDASPLPDAGDYNKPFRVFGGEDGTAMHARKQAGGLAPRRVDAPGARAYTARSLARASRASTIIFLRDCFLACITDEIILGVSPWQSLLYVSP
ncbi:MAG TPA: hypothetical protein VKZ48_05710 [Burkholderiales bacterium]|nr:hypothetical protein [Burkholderiales bacterium]